jgi:1-acyl-sn-glycerol-3-phosphate acyltransferase
MDVPLSAARDPLLIAVPPSVPRSHGRFARWFGRSVLRLGGWRVCGEIPDLPRLVILAAPHSSGWDAVWGLAARLALGLEVRFMGKAELFHGPLGRLLRWLGGVPVDRHAASGVVEQMAARFAGSERFWLALAPEGTRRRVERWRSGFWHIARAADVPVLCAYFHYPDKVIGFGPCIELGDDLDADMRRIRGIYAPWVGKHRGTV